ncbi:hypothetical protein [Luteibacter sp. 3190]|uniref:hypothetical protein n=1 Tax=Luteibacter sp. 3190 TaxID=2817736 RepID=UPI00285FA064|nr:hypothetical protein [Luteibacter sp. 3190]MDR6937331.1 hypothetical protein [Luteibacter sp. 3190]
MKSADDIKDILELARNVAFGCGIIALLGMVFYEPEAIGVTKHARIVGWTVTAAAVGYIALSIAQFELRHPLLRAPLARQRALGVFRLSLIVLICEGAAISAGAHIDWQQRNKTIVSLPHDRSCASVTESRIR